MEVLTCSDVQYSDCPQKESGTGFMCEGEPTCLEHVKQVEVTDSQVNELVLNVEGPQEVRQGEAQWTIDELPNSENGASYFEFEAEDNHFSCGSYDSGDDSLTAEEFCTESCLSTSHLTAETIDNGMLNDKDNESSVSEPQWLQNDEPMAVWVKWRGIWQAGIRCARADWPLATVKAKPTHDRKKYLVIFFPRRRNYSWADVLFVRPISEFPEPIAYRTHKIGMKMVKDLTVARRFIMQKLAVGMLNIVDQLHTEALVEIARDVAVWKEFVMEASQCHGYSDLGKMLLKLQSMIVQNCFSSDWLQHSFHSWVQQCQNASTAESVELLKEELFSSILWDKVNNLLSVVATHVSEWKNWKQEAMKLFSTSNFVANGGEKKQQTDDSSLPAGIHISRKRPKLEVRRAESHATQVDTHSVSPSLTVEIDAGFFDGGGTVNTSIPEPDTQRGEIGSDAAAPIEPPGSMSDRWGEIVLEAENSEITPRKDVETTSLDNSNKSNQCIAFIQAKGRQCVRWANDGDVYCCVHLASRFVGNNKVKTETTPLVDAQMCEGTTTLGTKCKHRSLYGSSFCKKHRPRNETDMILTTPDSNIKLKRKREEPIQNESCKDIVSVEEVDPPLHVDPISFTSREVPYGRVHELSVKEYDATVVLQCVGTWAQDGVYEPCSESPKTHSLYCEKHLPNWLKRARNGKSRIVSKEVFLDLLKDCHSREQKLYLHQACELFYRFFKSILSLRNPVPKEVQLQWAVSEASKDARVGAFLVKLVCCEIERLRKLWGFNDEKDTQVSSYNEEKDTQVSSHIEDSSLVPKATTDNDHHMQNTIKCKTCSEQFLDEQALGTHWMDRHKKQAKWLFRGYVCAICLDAFTNKKVLEKHVEERHHVPFVPQCVLLQCIPCSGHFGNPEQLWSHVLSAHSSNFRQSDGAQHLKVSADKDSLQKPELSNSVSKDKNNSEAQGGQRKFICKFCGLKFDLLPDLGRHHQAAHMGPNTTGARSSKRDIRFISHRLKSGRLNRPRFRKGLGSASYRIRNRGDASLRKRIQESNALGTEETEVQPNETEADTLGSLAESQCSTVANVLFSEIQKTKQRPSNLVILSIAQSACCKVSLQASLEAKYGQLPERLYLKAAKLCSEHNILVKWHKEGFVCPKGCGTPNVASPLMPLSEDVEELRSTLTEDPVNIELEMDESHFVIDSHHFKHNSVQKIFIMCDDISFGLESVPVICVVDEDLLGSLHMVKDSTDRQITEQSMPWEDFTYVNKPMLGGSLCLEPESLQFGCACTQSTCSPQNCDHVYLFENDFEDAKDIYGKTMQGRFPYDGKGRIILEEGYLVYECSHRCSCSRSCQNRVLQNGVQFKLEVFKTEKKGWGVRAQEEITRGTFVCELIGEVIDEQEANKRHDRYGGEGWGYFYYMDAFNNDASKLIDEPVSYIVDATNYGNVSRYINHSCSPNLVNYQVLVESMDSQRVHIGLYARHDIAAGEELTFDCRYKLLPGEGQECYCGASNCRGRLY